MPRFRMTSRPAIKDTLQTMGMTLAFDREADFSRMCRGEGIYISTVIHEASVEVNEKGTEATAATAVMKAKSARQKKPAVFRADHPFLFLIQDNRTGCILFIGRVANPVE
jgi:serpin B